MKRSVDKDNTNNESLPQNRFPFNSSTPFRYAIALALEFILLFSSLLNGITILSYFIGLPWLLQSCVKDISFDVSFLDVDEILNRNRIEMIDCFRNILQDFSTVKELSENSDRNWTIEIRISIYSFSFPFSHLSRFCNQFNQHFGVMNTISYIWMRLTG